MHRHPVSRSNPRPHALPPSGSGSASALQSCGSRRWVDGSGRGDREWCNDPAPAAADPPHAKPHLILLENMRHFAQRAKPTILIPPERTCSPGRQHSGARLHQVSTPSPQESVTSPWLSCSAISTAPATPAARGKVARLPRRSRSYPHPPASPRVKGAKVSLRSIPRPDISAIFRQTRRQTA